MQVYVETAINWSVRQMQVQVQCGVTGAKKGLHTVASMCNMPPGPKDLVGTISAIAGVLFYIPPLAVPMQPLKAFTKEIKTFFNYLKGIRSVDALVNTKNKAWKVIALHVSGAALLILATCDYIKKFGWSNLEGLHAVLNRIPVVNVLTYSGLFGLALIGLQTSLFLIALDKEKELKSQKLRSETKITVWQERKIQKVKEEAFCQAKLEKWKLKIHKIDKERHANAFSMGQRVCTIASTIITSAALVTGVGTAVAFPTAAVISLADASFGIASLIIKKSADNIVISPVKG